MTLKVDISQLADIANQNNVAGADEAIEALEKVADELAQKVAHHFRIISLGSDHQPVEFGGLLVSFGPGHVHQQCPKAIHEADPDGDWGVVPTQR